MSLNVVMAIAQGSSLMEMKMGGMSVMKQAVNPKYGYSVQQGRKSDMPQEQWAEAQSIAHPFKEFLMLDRKDVVLSGIESVDDKDCYVLVMGDKKFYYDIKTGLKVAESTDVENNGEKMTMFTYYRNYERVKGMLIPHMMVMNVGMELEFKFSDVLINEEVTAKDFE
jgi:hypothetical protein